MPDIEELDTPNQKDHKPNSRSGKKLSALTMILALAAGINYAVDEDGMNFLGDLPSASEDFTDDTRESLRRESVGDYSQTNAFNKYTMTYINPPRSFRNPDDGGKGLLGIIGRFIETDSGNYIPNGSNSCLAGTDYDPYRYTDDSGEVRGGAQVIPFGDDVIVIEPIDLSKPKLVFRGASEEYGNLRPARIADLWNVVAAGCREILP
jgi:hypothetical protein